MILLAMTACKKKIMQALGHHRDTARQIMDAHVNPSSAAIPFDSTTSKRPNHPKLIFPLWLSDEEHGTVTG